MKTRAFILIAVLIYCGYVIANDQNTISIGQRYIAFLNLFTTPNADFLQEFESLFAPNMHKIINSKIICRNRTELLQQMTDIVTHDGVINISLLELITTQDAMMNIVRFEITFGDNNTESVISIIKGNEAGMITEINEVFGNKEAYDWPMKGS